MTEAVLDRFLEECRELVDQGAGGLIALERTPTDAGLINTVFRAFHTIKGGSGLFDLLPLTRVLHAAEDLLHAAREGKLTLSPAMIDVLFTVLDQVNSWLDLLQSDALLPEDADEVAEGLVAATAAAGGIEVAVAVKIAEPTIETLVNTVPEWLKFAGRVPEFVGHELVGIEYDPDPGCFFTGDDPLRLMSLVPSLLYLRILGIDELPQTRESDPFECRLRFRAVSAAPAAELRSLFRYVSEGVKLYEFSLGLGPEAEACVRLLRQVSASLQEPTDAPRAAARRASQILLVRRALEASGLPLSWLETFSATAERSLRAADDDGLQRATERILEAISAASRCGMRLSVLPQAHRSATLSLAPARPSCPPASLRASSSAPSTLPRRLTLPEPPPPIVIRDAEAAASPAPTAAVTAPIESPTLSVAEATSGTKTSDRHPTQVYKVEQGRIDALLELAGELLVAKNALPYLSRRAETTYGAPALAREIKDQAAVLNRLADGFHHAVMQLRIIPISHIFDRFPRLVRDLSRQLGKRVRLEVEGDTTEADKATVERLADPLIHIARNSLDHGLELPEERVKSGKPEEGVLRISAHQERGLLLVTVQDDGQGIDPELVRSAAVRRGVIGADEAARMSDAEAVQLVFRAGFSTREQISNLSGRGVGMDVVRTAVEACGGTVHLTSQRGQGTQVQLSLPLSMAVTRVLLVDTGGQAFGVPFDLVLETLHLSRSDVAHIGGAQVATVRDKVVPIIPLDRLLGLVPSSPEASAPSTQGDDRLKILLVRLPGGDAGIVVEGLREAVDVMLKPLDGPLASVRGYLGASLLGDGRALLVLNLAELI